MAQKIVVFGGNGFVGSHVCKKALDRGLSVVSVNRSGKPLLDESWISRVQWVAASSTNPEAYREALKDATGVVTCIGGFGTTDHMQKVCGDANIIVSAEAKNAGVKNISFVSEAHVDYGFQPWFPLYGYMNGKKRAETAILADFPNNHAILRPSAIYGSRRVGSMNVPLQMVLKPVEWITTCGVVRAISNRVPYSGLVLDPPVDVENVAEAAVAGALGEAQGILQIPDITHKNYRKL